MNEKKLLEYYQSTDPQCEDPVSDIASGDMKIYSKERVMAEKAEWLAREPRIVSIMGTLRAHDILYKPADMVNFRYCFSGEMVKMSDEVMIAVRILLAIAKLPPFQKRLGTAYKKGIDGLEFFEILAGGPSETEKLECSGQFHVSHAMQCDTARRLRKQYKLKYPTLDQSQVSDATRWKWMYDVIVEEFGELNWRALVEGDPRKLLNFIRNELMEVLIPFLANGYTIEQVVRSGLDEEMPWKKITECLPYGAYSFMLPDEDGHTPDWCFGCTSLMYDEEVMNCEIQYFSLCACSLQKLVELSVEWQDDCKAIGTLKMCINRYTMQYGYKPSPKKFAKWLADIGRMQSRSLCLEESITRIITSKKKKK